MKYLNIPILTFIVLFTFSTHVKAEELQTITIDNDTIEYTHTFNDLENATSYYKEDTLVLTEYDDDKNGKPDSWTLYRPDLTIKKEVQDSDGDGVPDIFHEYDTNENITKSTGDGLKQYEVEEMEELEEEIIINNSNTTEEIDYAGDLTDIKKLAGESEGWINWLIALLVLVGGGYFWWKKKKANN